ncbi:unannotated protein [freshwater metagenome]|uniref:Unannotated protein n=1 Tax=freshwater metagenome TaxID=449393 RepID=A0A6J6DEI3_9ZZZZ
MRDDDDCVVVLEFVNEVFDGERGDGVEGRAGLVHQQHIGLHGNGTRDTQTLLLSTRESGSGLIQALLDLFPEVCSLERRLDEVICIRLRNLLAVELYSREYVVSNRHRGERVGTLKHHSHLTSNFDRVGVGCVEVLAVDQNLSFDARAGDHFVHAVECAQEGGLAATGGADEGGDRLGLDGERNVGDGFEVAVVDIEVANLDALRHESFPFVSFSESPWGRAPLTEFERGCSTP